MFQFTHPGGVRLSQGGQSYTFSSVSIHAPGRGATYVSGGFLLFSVCFNSRTREGCDPGMLLSWLPRLEFQFTHPGGVRLTAPSWIAPIIVLFQFTHPGGVRHKALINKTMNKSFNSRTREGCDRGWSHRSPTLPVFQFTHPGGVRPPMGATTAP